MSCPGEPGLQTCQVSTPVTVCPQTLVPSECPAMRFSLVHIASFNLYTSAILSIFVNAETGLQSHSHREEEPGTNARIPGTQGTEHCLQCQGPLFIWPA